MAREVGVNHVSLSVTTGASVELLGPNPGRLYLIFSPPTSSRYTLGFGRPAVVDQGLTVLSTSTIVIIPGEVWRGEINVFQAVGTAFINVVEVYLL